jgi:CheY-like chemotaxis protein
MTLSEKTSGPASLEPAKPLSSEPAPPGVLLAEDEETLRRTLGRKLQGEGFTVWQAADGREAVELFRAHHSQIKAALLDVHMPELNGPEALEALRRIEPTLPCCFMTAWSGQYPGERLARLGGSRVLVKPFTLVDLISALRALCRRAEGEGSDEAGPTPAPDR